MSKNVAFVLRHSFVFVIRLPSRSLGEGWCFVIRSMSFAASPRFRSSDRPNDNGHIAECERFGDLHRRAVSDHLQLLAAISDGGHVA